MNGGNISVEDVCEINNKKKKCPQRCVAATQVRVARRTISCRYVRYSLRTVRALCGARRLPLALISLLIGRAMFHLSLPERASNSTADEARRLAIFFHMHKCAGTSVREMFRRSGSWSLLPYCLPVAKVLTKLNSSFWQPRMFWEQHCAVRMQGLAETLQRAEESVHGRGMSIISFTVLRDPVDVALSEHAHFHHNRLPEEWLAGAGSELFLFGRNHLGFQRPPATSFPLNDSLCSSLVQAALHLLAPLSLAAFVEQPTTMEQLRVIAGAGAGPPRLYHQNQRCAWCHAQPTQTLIPSDQRWLTQRPNMSALGKRLHAAAEQHNSCSRRVYTALRSSR